MLTGPNGPKRAPPDVIGNTFYVMEIATGEIEESVPADGKDPAAKALGKKGAPETYFVPPFNGPKVRRRGRSYTGVELPEHRQTQLLDRLILDRVRQFGHVAEGHGSLRNGSSYPPRDRPD